LRKIESSREKKVANIDDSIDAWEVADEETSINKVKQALREHEAPSSKIEAPSAKPQPIGKRKKNSDVGNFPDEAIKSVKKKKKGENQADAPMSLAESIRANASKLGTDFSFVDAPYTTLVPMAPRETMSDSAGDNNFPSTTHILRSNLELIGDSLSKASRFPDKPSGILKQESGNEQCEKLIVTERRHEHERIQFPPTMAASITQIDTINNSIHIDTATTDSKREYLHNEKLVSESILSRTGSSSDDDKKPAAI
jgi:hypothetical protein